MVNSGASVPPEVPLPSEIDHEMNFIAHRNEQRRAGERAAERCRSMLS